MVTRVKAPETRDQAIIRLAAQARERGVQIFNYDPTREYFATSISEPGTLHRVTALSCDCLGFLRFGRCTHHSALLDHIGELPVIVPDPEPNAATVAPLTTSGGYPIPAPAALAAVLQARAEVARRSKQARSTADFWRLQAARVRLDQLTSGSVITVAA